MQQRQIEVFFNTACVLLEQKLERELLFFACEYHAYKLVLKSVFETKFYQFTNSLEMPLLNGLKIVEKVLKPIKIKFSKTLSKRILMTEMEELLKKNSITNL